MSEPTESGPDKPKLSDGAAEAVVDIGKGAVTGAAAGGLGGAAAGAGKAALKFLGKNPKARKRALMVAGGAIVTAMVPLLVVAMFISSLGGSMAVSHRANQEVGVKVATESGVQLAELEVIRGSAGRGVMWEVLASTLQTAKTWTGGSGPFRLTAEAAAKVGPPGAEDLKASSDYIASQLVWQMRVAGFNPSVDIGDGATVRADGTVVWHDDSDHQRRVVEPLTEAISKLPVEGMTNDGARYIVDQAILWRLGLRMSPTSMGGGTMVCAPSGDTLTHDAVQRPDHLSVGIWQQQPWWGPDTKSLMDLDWSTRAFFGKSGMPGAPPGMLQINGWETMAPGPLAQAIQRSAYPDAYNKWEPVARALVGKAKGITCNTAGAAYTGPMDGKWDTVFAILRSKIGTPYSWGGGTVDGPSLGFAQGANTVGWDCSSYVRYGVYQATGGKVDISRTTDSQTAKYPQFRVMVSSVTELQPGDLIYTGGTWRSPTHVTMYSGNGMMLEEPRTGLAAREVPVRIDNLVGVIRLPLTQLAGG